MRALVLTSLLVLAGTTSVVASELDDTAIALSAVSIAETDNTVIPAALVPLEARFKRLLRDAAVRSLPDVDVDKLDLAALKPVLDALAQRYAPADDGDEGYRSGAIYGRVLAVRAERPPGRPDLVAILTNVRIGCGEDASLALLARRDGRWVNVLDVDSGAIRRIDDAFSLFDYRVSPVAADGSFYVVDAHVTPWCQSNWRMLRQAVHRVTRAAPARAIFKADDEIVIGVEAPVFEIRLRPAGYTLHFTATGRDDPADWESRSVDFSVQGDRVRRGRTRFDPAN